MDKVRDFGRRLGLASEDEQQPATLAPPNGQGVSGLKRRGALREPGPRSKRQRLSPDDLPARPISPTPPFDNPGQDVNRTAVTGGRRPRLAPLVIPGAGVPQVPPLEVCRTDLLARSASPYPASPAGQASDMPVPIVIFTPPSPVTKGQQEQKFVVLGGSPPPEAGVRVEQGSIYQ